MTSVFVLERSYPHEGSNILGVFTTVRLVCEHLAEIAMREGPGYFNDGIEYLIYRFMVDSPASKEVVFSTYYTEWCDTSGVRGSEYENLTVGAIADVIEHHIAAAANNRNLPSLGDVLFFMDRFSKDYDTALRWSRQAYEDRIQHTKNKFNIA